jgi:hypothetical protein
MSVYFYPTDFISGTGAVIKQARNVLPADFTTQNIEEFEYQAYSLIRTILNKDDWASTDREFGAIQRINVDLAVAYIRKHYGKTDEYERGAASETRCIQELHDIEDNLDTPTGEEDLAIAKTPRRGWNVNPDVPVPRGNLTIS